MLRKQRNAGLWKFHFNQMLYWKNREDKLFCYHAEMCTQIAAHELAGKLHPKANILFAIFC